MLDEATAETPPVRLPAPTRQKAMDWSLVLASQGIPHFIASPDESGEWSLRIALGEGSRASSAIRQYEIENHHRPWQQPCLEGRLVFDWIVLAWIVPLVIIHALSEAHPHIKDAGVMHGLDVSLGQWWRLVTATQLHADWGHLASNLAIGFVVLGLVMGRWGTATGMLAALLCGVGGNVGNWFIAPERFSLGASAMVTGCIGLLALPQRRKTEPHSPILAGLLGSMAGAIMLFMLLGLDPRTDVLAHTGGFVTGLALAALFRALPTLTHSRTASWAATGLIAGLVCGAWLCLFLRTTAII